MFAISILLLGLFVVSSFAQEDSDSVSIKRLKFKRNIHDGTAFYEATSGAHTFTLYDPDDPVNPSVWDSRIAIRDKISGNSCN